MLQFSIVYADDTSVQISGNDITYVVVSSLNVKLELLSRWLKANHLSLNAQYFLSGCITLSHNKYCGNSVIDGVLESSLEGYNGLQFIVYKSLCFL